MKLDHDLVRLVLLEIEDKTTIKDDLQISDFSIPNYSNEEITYTIQKLNEAGYINAKIKSFIGGSVFFVDSLTWDGHQFLDNIRDDNVWDKTKGILSKFSSASLSIASDVAANVITKLINQQMGF
ncbi:MAG: DUF2513 domain-containing protein [Faecalicoccus sp.]|uniref:DUF2513 domain-containing protein n=1 Tax=Faecalicoccus sp. TaxID=1971758 RepID=UPI002F92D534